MANRLSLALALAATLAATLAAVLPGRGCRFVPRPTVTGTLAVVVTPKAISDFEDPMPSIRHFFDSYAALTERFEELLVVFQVGSGDHIYRYPADAFAPFDPAVRRLAGATTVKAPGPSGRAAPVYDLFPPGQGIPLTEFPLFAWDWRKEGGATLVLRFRLRHRGTGETTWIGYYAGETPPGASFEDVAQVFLGDLPAAWRRERVNLLSDLGDVLVGRRRGPERHLDGWEVTGVALAPLDGSSASLDRLEAETSAGVEWARHTWNLPFERHREMVNQRGRVYPQELTYGQIRSIVRQFREEGRRRRLRVKVLDGVESGPEFTFQPWRARMHPEVIVFSVDPGYVGMAAIGFDRPLKGDSYPYAAYPAGLPEGTPSGDFLVRQIGRYVEDLGFDGLYSNNGFGLQPWGAPTLACPSPGPRGCEDPAQRERILSFFRELKRALKGKPHLWMDTYLAPSLNEMFWSMPTEAFRHLDYVQLSTYWQDRSFLESPPGVPVTAQWVNVPRLNKILGQEKTAAQYMQDDIVETLALKESHPRLRVLYTLYFADPWYDYRRYGRYVNLDALTPHLARLDGLMLYGSNYKGEHIPLRTQARVERALP
jgi:hypothetical protein